MKKAYVTALCSDEEPAGSTPSEIKKAYKLARIPQDRKKHIKFQIENLLGLEDCVTEPGGRCGSLCQGNGCSHSSTAWSRSPSAAMESKQNAFYAFYALNIATSNLAPPGRRAAH